MLPELLLPLPARRVRPFDGTDDVARLPTDSGVPTSGPSPDGGAVSRVLSPAEARSVEQALASVTYQDPPTCGGEDGEEYYLTTYDAAGATLRVYSAFDINCTLYPMAPEIVSVYQRLTQLRMQ